MSDELVEAVTRYTDKQAGDSPYATAIDGLAILRANHERKPSHLFFRPALCLTIQGSKWTAFGNKRFVYKAGQALLVRVEVPAFGRITEASPEKPYLGLIIELDPAILRDVVEEFDAPPPARTNRRSGIFVIDFEGPLADCALRAMRLLDTPKAIPVLYPSIMREICYWLLAGPHGAEIAQMALSNNPARRVVRAIHALRDRFAEQIRIEELARIARLSPSAFHRQFKAMTSMTPLQYQKRMRLLEARRLMVSGATNAETAAFQVGYESPSQFSREYSRMFGTPPRRDVVAMRSAAA